MGHFLKNIKRIKLPKHVLFIDSETRQVNRENYSLNYARLVWLCLTTYDDKGNIIKEKWKVCYDGVETCNYIEFVSNSINCLYIVASNACFDLSAIGFFRYFSNSGYELNFFSEKGLHFILSIKKGKHYIKCISIQNFLRYGVKTLGEFINKKKIEIDVFTDDMDLLSIYCFRDVEIIIEAYSLYLQFVSQNELGGFAYTTPGQAFKAWRSKYNKSKLLIHGQEIVSQFEKQSYFGGRVECFHIGKLSMGLYYLLDVNSLYPYVMKEHMFPIALKGIIEKNNIGKLEVTLRKHCVIAEVTIETNEPVYPKIINGKLCFPIGKFNTTLCTESLRYALNNGHIKDIINGLYYDKGYLFKDYINDCFEKRYIYKKQGNKIMEELCKHLMTDLYGKFGERHDVCIEKHKISGDKFYINDFIKIETNETGQTIGMFGIEQTFQGKEFAKNSMVSIAAHVTDYGKMLLWKYIKICGIDKVLYCDTDSLIISEDTFNTLPKDIIGDKIGQLKIELISNNVTIFGLKDYIFGDRIRIKGITRGTTENERGYFEVLQSLKLSSLIKKDLLDCAVLRTVEKHITREYNKGIVNSSGKVFPFLLSE